MHIPHFLLHWSSSTVFIPSCKVTLLIKLYLNPCYILIVSPVVDIIEPTKGFAERDTIFSLFIFANLYLGLAYLFRLLWSRLNYRVSKEKTQPSVRTLHRIDRWDTRCKRNKRIQTPGTNREHPYFIIISKNEEI